MVKVPQTAPFEIIIVNNILKLVVKIRCYVLMTSFVTCQLLVLAKDKAWMGLGMLIYAICIILQENSSIHSKHLICFPSIKLIISVTLHQLTFDRLNFAFLLVLWVSCGSEQGIALGPGLCAELYLYKQQYLQLHI